MLAIKEILPAHIEHHVKKKMPFVIRNWFPEAKDITDDPDWKNQVARVVKIPRGKCSVNAAAYARTHELTEADYHRAFTLIREEREGRKYYLFGNLLPSQMINKLTWPKAVAVGCIYAASKGVKGKAHFDLWDMFQIQCVGTKVWQIAAPSNYPFLYPINDKKSGIERRCVIDLDNPDFKKYPLFKRAKFLTSTLNPGDLLYLPPLWWHEVDTKSFSISLNAFLPHKISFYYAQSILWHYYALQSRYIYKTSCIPSDIHSQVRSLLKKIPGALKR